MNIKVATSIIGLLICMTTSAQDYQFTQFYAAPVNLNPAFTGNTTQSRVVMNYRNQWTAIPGAFVTYNLTYEHFIPKIKSGVGILLNHDQAGSGNLGYTSVLGLYSYEFQINYDLYIRPGVSFGKSFRTLDYNKLVFGDQLVRPDGSSTIETFEDIGSSFFDVGTGVLMYSHDFWIGASAAHINKPNESLRGQEALVPIKASIHGGYRNMMKKKTKSGRLQSTLAAFNYRMQEDFDQLDLGIYYEYSPVVFGVWYRGLPGFKKNDYGVLNHDAIALLFGYEIRKLKFGYSYDITISPLISSTAGSHEVSLIYEFHDPRNRKYSKRKRIIPCARF
ncbi:MAG: PorP/SprF family type IX secretion system membrane protein [Flavobacteriales bacterium]|nr:PorP/SprF family type IX secretion system membrane protein [Flavobacteriales bacterium]